MDARTANVLFGDVKGYSSLDDSQLKTFAENILPLAASRIANFKYFHVNTWGDGIIVACEEILEAARIAVELRDLFGSLDWQRYKLPPLDIRLSLHHGEYYRGKDPFTSRGLLAGRSIILAARVEPITLPGRVWITESAAVMLGQADRSETRHFEADEIGLIPLPKGAGEEKLYLLRRRREPALTAEEKSDILNASRIRKEAAEGAVDGPTDATDFEVCIGIVIHKGQVLMVRRNRDASGLEWMFPAGKKLAVDDERYVVVKEVKQETGVSCLCLDKIADVDCHPLTGARCHFYHLKPLDDVEPANLDSEENADARYVPIPEVSKFIPKHLTPQVAAFLDGHRV